MMPVQNIFAQIQLKSKIGQGFDLDQERYELSQKFNSALKRANLGQWTGSAIKSDSLVFYFLVTDIEQAGDVITNCFGGYENRSEFKRVKIRRM
jgi:hypothetical protein